MVEFQAYHSNFHNHSFWIDMMWRYEWIVSSVKKKKFLFLPLSTSFQCEPQYAHIAQSTILKGCWSWSIDTRQAILWLHHWNPQLVSVDWLTSWWVSGMADAASCYRDQLLAPKNTDLRVWVFGLLSVQRNLLDGSLSTECWGFFFKSILYISSLPARESGFLVNVDRTPPSDSTAHSTNVSCPYLTSSPAAPYASVLHLVFPVLKFEKAFSIISKHCLVFVFLHFKAPLWSGNLLCCACISRLIWSNILVNRGEEVARDKQRQNES